MTRLLHEGLPLLDVRAPVEYQQGAIPGSENHPILDDAQRHRVGLTYKHSGPDAAEALGHKLVSGAVKAQRLSAWSSFVRNHPTAQVMCWRGGRRSTLAQQWLAEEGIHLERVPGGYQSLRRACLDTLEKATDGPKQWWVVAGRTGVQKTVLINRLPNSIDLEGLAHHRGSAFGAHATPQPTPANFENALACAFLQHQSNQLVLEDESRTIGRLALPVNWHQHMQQAPLVLLEADLTHRVQHIVTEYVTQALVAGESSDTLQGRYRDSLRRITRRLGGSLHRHIEMLLERAFAGQEPHEAWVEALLQGYYDPMYDYQLKRKAVRIHFRGNQQEIIDFLRQQNRAL